MTRKDISMTNKEMVEFLEQPWTLHVATIGKDGYPHLAPMWYVIENGRIVFRSFTKSQKIVNLQRNPKVSVSIETGNTYAELQGVMIRGTAQLVTNQSYIRAVYKKMAVRYSIANDLADKLGQYAEKNTAVVVEPHKIVTWDHRKLGGTY